MIKNLRFCCLFLIAFVQKKFRLLLTVFLILLAVMVLTRLVLVNGGSQLYTEASSKLTKPNYIEGVVGSVNTLNPVYEKTLTEKEINSLVFRGLTKVSEDGRVEPDLAESFLRKSPTKYVFKLKENIFWQDGLPVTVDDVIHTIDLTQQTETPSELSANFKGVKVVRIDDRTLEFNLEEPFAPFILNTTIGIVPKHVSLEEYKPVGTGDFKVVEILEERITLESKSSKITFRIYKNKDEALLALKLGEIDGLGGLSFFDVEEMKFWPNLSIYSADLKQRQVVLFFNMKDKKLASKDMRQALSYSVPKELVTQILPEFNLRVSSYSLPLDSWASGGKSISTKYDLKKAQENLKKQGYKKQGDFYTKEGKDLSLTLTTSDDPELQEVARLVKDAWQTLGIDVNVVNVPSKELKDVTIPERNFQTLLIVQELSVDPDQYSLWHSSQINDANISALSSDKVDKVLEDGRKILDQKKRKKTYATFNRILSDEAPAIFLYHPKYFWLVNKKVENIDLNSFIQTSDRFNNIKDWKYKNSLFN